MEQRSMGVFRAQWINQHCPLAWCKEHAVQYVRIAKLAQRYLSASRKWEGVQCSWTSTATNARS